METLIGLIVGSLISWLVTHYYYKRSLEDQREAWTKHEEQLLSRLKDSGENDEFLKNEIRINTALNDYKKRGTPKYVIDTFNDLTNEQKAKLYDDVLLRAKGRPGKNNPYR